MKKIIYDFIRTQTHAVIATVNISHIPESAYVGFGETEDLILIFGTDKTSRKYQNILHNPNVAFNFTHGKITVQYEGVASLFEKNELEKYKQLFFAKNPYQKEHDKNENQTYVKVIPKWVRYSDFGKVPVEIFELTNFS